jgi:hypothetical protein
MTEMKRFARALELAREYGILDNDSIRQCYLLITNRKDGLRRLRWQSNLQPLRYDPDLCVYDALTGGALSNAYVSFCTSKRMVSRGQPYDSSGETGWIPHDESAGQLCLEGWP